MLRLENITIGYGRRVLARGLCARFEAGTLNAVIGRNGAGKSTLLRVMAGIEKPLGGEVFYSQESGVKSQESRVRSQESANAGGKLGDETIRRLDNEAIRQLDDGLTRHRSCAAQKLRGVNVGSITSRQSDAGGGQASASECQPSANAGGKLGDEAIRQLGDGANATQTDAREGLQPAASGGGWLTGSESPKNTDAGGGMTCQPSELGGGGLRTSNEVRANATQISAPPTAPSGGADGLQMQAGEPAALPHDRLITHDSSLMTLPRERLVSFVSTERPRVANLRVGDVVALGRAPYTGWLGRLSAEDERVVDQSINVVGISSFVTKQLDTLSDGEAQRVMIARALAQDTPVILLDEPTAFLDFHSRREIVELLCDLAHKHGKTVVFSSHELDLVKEFSDKIIQL